MSDKAKNFKEICDEQDANQASNYEARVNSTFLDAKASEKKVVVYVPDREAKEGNIPITVTILYDDKQDGISLKLNGKTKFQQEHLKYLANHFYDIMKY